MGVELSDQYFQVQQTVSSLMHQTHLVTIRNFSINGAGTTLGINGIRVIAVKKLAVENCTLSNFSANGIDVNTTTAADIAISNVTIHNASTGISIVGPGGSTGSAGFTVIDGCHIQGILNSGINIGSGTATVGNSVISGCGIGVSRKQGQQLIYQEIL